MEKKKYYLFALLWITLIFSCADEQDFNQYDDLNVTPTYETSILYVEVPERTINLISGLNTYSQNFEFDAFSEDFFSDRVLEGTLTYVATNTTSKPFEFSLQFLDEAGNVIDSELFEMGAEPTASIRREIYYGPAGKDINIIRNIKSITLAATNLGDNSSTSSQPNPLVALQSSGEFTVELK